MLTNCTEATRYIDEKGDELFNCTECAENNDFIYKADIDKTICLYFHYDKWCMVKNCRICKEGNNYFCSQCLQENYEVNHATGSCVKKMENTPAISWKDIYRLILNDNYDINTQKIYGPSLFIRGITNSDISQGHSFFVKLVFLVRYTRNLEENGNGNTIETEEKSYTGICTIVDSNSQRSNKVGIVDYKCIGNRTGEDDFRESEVTLKTVKGDDSFLKNTNFAQVSKAKNFENIINQNYSTFTIRMLDQIITFEMEDVLNQISEDYLFDFTINGKIDKDSEPKNLKGKLYIVEIEDKSADCVFTIGKNRNADLNCKIDLEDYQDLNTFTFKTLEIENGNSTIFLDKITEVKLIHRKKDLEATKKKTDIIKIILIVAAVILIVAVVIIIILVKKLSTKKVLNNDDFIIYTKTTEKIPQITKEKIQKIKKPKANDDIEQLSTKRNVNEIKIKPKK